MTAGRPRTLPRRASIAIIGGGIQGLSVAFNLAALGQRDVIVLDAGYFQGGASGRNGTLIRGGFMSDEWTALFCLANRRWLELSKRLRHNVMFSRRGYLLLAERPETAANFDLALATHARHGVASRRVSGQQLRDIAPALNATRIEDAIYFEDGGTAPHHAAMHAYLHACLEADVCVEYQAPVIRIERAGAGACAVIGRDFEIEVSSVVLAAGGFTNAVVRAADLELPGFPLRLEAMALEPVRPVIRPAMAFIDSLCYLSQTARGEIVGGAEVPERPRHSLQADLPAMAATARVYRDMLPCLSQLRILRHWAGTIHATPDFGPLIGAHPKCHNLWVTAGWSYGYASAPAVGELLARSILSNTIDPLLAPFAIDRFDRGAAVREGGIVLAPSHHQSQR
jgi:sarcosine oxidase, subunit beta